jgi:hypothetical protein
MNEEVYSVLRIATVIISVFYGLWQYFQKRKLENFISNKAIGLSKTIAIALGASQAAKKSLNNAQVASNEIGRTEGLINSALIESADLFCSLRRTTIDDIQELSQNNTTINDYQAIFKMFSDRKIGFIRRVFRCISKVY